MLTHAVRIHRFGGPDVLSWEEVELAEPGPGEVLIRNTAVGVNFIDLHQRSGTYHSDFPLPAILGAEGAGVVEQIGAGVADVSPGDRVAYSGPPFGAYAERRLFPAARTVKLPPAIDDKTAAAILLKGLTAQYLTQQAHRVQPGEVILVHGAAGGVGVILCQWAAAAGAVVIGTVSTDEKAAIAKTHGCRYTIVVPHEDLLSRIKELTEGKMVSVVYDSIGKDTFNQSIDSLRRRGLMVSYGFKSGPIPPIDPNLLMKKGSLVFTRTTGKDFNLSRSELLTATSSLFDEVSSGRIRPLISNTYNLREVAQVHGDLESRKTMGSIVLSV
jgi:NADPH2:quinone reductase